MRIEKQKVIKGCAVAYLALRILFAFFFVAVIALAGMTTALSMKCQVSREPVDFMGSKVFLAYTDMGMGSAVQKYSLLIVKEPKLDELVVDGSDARKNSIVVYYSKDYKPNGLVAQRILSQEIGLNGEPELRFIIKGDSNATENPTPVKFEEILGVVDRQVGITRLAMLSVTNIWFLIFALLLPAILLIVVQLTGVAETLSVKSAFEKKRDFEDVFQATAGEESELSPEVIARVKEMLMREQSEGNFESGVGVTDSSVSEADSSAELENSDALHDDGVTEKSGADSQEAQDVNATADAEREKTGKESKGNASVARKGTEQSGSGSSRKSSGKSYPYAKHSASGKHKKNKGRR